MYFKSQNYKLVNYAMNLLTSRNIVCPFTEGVKKWCLFDQFSITSPKPTITSPIPRQSYGEFCSYLLTNRATCLWLFSSKPQLFRGFTCLRAFYSENEVCVFRSCLSELHNVATFPQIKQSSSHDAKTNEIRFDVKNWFATVWSIYAGFISSALVCITSYIRLEVISLWQISLKEAVIAAFAAITRSLW